jgi:3-hydroxyisobutyrate dehydrogenase-like beta-hydroxyacid dehydrogenase
VRGGAAGKEGPFEDLTRHVLPGNFEPPDFALRLAHKDTALAVAVGRELGVPMRLANLAMEEMTEALNRGWGGHDSRSSLRLQEERAGVEVRASKDALEAALKELGKDL